MTNLRLQIAEPMGAFLQSRRHKIARGGRGSAKSWSIARLLVARAAARRTRWLCCREVQKSIKESSHRLLAATITAMDMGGLFRVQRDVIRGPRGSEFIFTGLRDHTADTIKSFEDLDGAWIEEAHKVTHRSAQILIPTVRNAGSEIWWSYNPDQEDDFVHELAESGRSDVLVVTMNYDANAWFPPELEAERLQLKAINDDLYQHVWEGKCRSAAGLLFKRNWFKRFKLGSEPAELNRYMSSDWAGGPDPNDPDSEPDFTEHGVVGLNPTGDLYFLDGWSGQTDPHVWIQAGIALAARHKVQMGFEEKGVILRTVDAAINKAMEEAGKYYYRMALASAGNKASRALGLAARAAAGKVYVAEGEWGDRFINQLCAFNGQDGRIDDMVDMGSLLARGLDEMANALPPPPPPPKSPEPFSDPWFAARDRADAMDEADQQKFYR
jgi:predicted phage terminase large subunit-like protein